MKLYLHLVTKQRGCYRHVETIHLGYADYGYGVGPTAKPQQRIECGFLARISFMSGNTMFSRR